MLPTAQITESDLAYIVDICAPAQTGPGLNNEPIAEWAEVHDETDDSSLRFMEQDNLADIEQNLVTSLFHN